MQWFDETAKSLEKGKVYTHRDILGLLKKDYPYVSQNSYHWAVEGMVKAGKLVRTGYNQYMAADGTEKPVYVPKYSETAGELIDRLDNTFPDTKFVVMETRLINEFLEQRIGQNVLFVQAQKDAGLPIFRFLQEEKYPGVMYKPPLKMFDLHRTEGSIAVTDLASEPPLNTKDPHEVCIEKMLVDMFCDRYITRMYDSAGFPKVMERADGRYLVERPKLLRYARRRGKEDALISTAPRFFGVEPEEAIMERRCDILWAAAEIIGTLPASQKELFDDINYGKLTQAEIARYNNITPQAVTNRIHRLYATLVRRLVEERGFPEKEVRDIAGGNEVNFLRAIVR